MTAAREHAIANTCAQLNLKILADNAHVGAGGTAITPIKRRPNAQLPHKHKTSTNVHAALPAPEERTISRIKQCQTFPHARIIPNRRTSVATLMISTRKRLTVCPHLRVGQDQQLPSHDQASQALLIGHIQF
ncbi:hypothetical protein [Streptomyces sp. NPDC007205]|uniref:hypothetical protein n=1 Tax=Streptomyces sp. NPDC007205 TaxID=3154316 RepID=UPI00341140FB